MSTYIMLSTLTDEGRKTLKERPERLQEVNKELENMGARVVSQHAVLGGYDFVNVIEAPSNEIMARISMELGSRGTIKITTLPAMAIKQFVEMMAGAPPKAGGESA
ncbi:MAG: GYD domain-containing protein [Pseudomonadales bacterium]